MCFKSKPKKRRVKNIFSNLGRIRRNDPTSVEKSERQVSGSRPPSADRKVNVSEIAACISTNICRGRLHVEYGVVHVGLTISERSSCALPYQDLI